MYEDEEDFYDDDFEEDFDEDFEPDPENSFSLKNEVLCLIEEYDIAYRSQEDTQRFLSECIADICNFTYLKETEIILKIYEQAMTYVSPFIANRIIAESFLFLFNHEKTSLTSYPNLEDWEEELLVSRYIGLLRSSLAQDLSKQMSASHNGRYILVIIEDLLSWIEKIEGRKRVYRSSVDRGASVSREDDDWSMEDMEEALYWIAAGEGEVDPSEERTTSYSGFYEEYEEVSFHDDYRNDLKFSAGTLRLYFDLIIDSPDIGIDSKELALTTFMRRLNGLVDNLSLSDAMVAFRDRLSNESTQLASTLSPDSDLRFMNVVSGYGPVQLAIEIDGLYESLSQKHNHEAALGMNGALSLIGAVLLADYDDSIQEFVIFGIEQVFNQNWESKTFEGFITAIVRDRSSISIDCWEEVSMTLRQRHSWIRTHKIAR